MAYDNIEVNSSDIDNRGVFAKAEINRGERVVQYTGRKLTKAKAMNSSSLYLFELNSRFDIDGRNIARYINHSCEPNCEADVIKGEIWITAIRDIAAGDELSYNYHYTFEDAKDFPCRCGTDQCAGYIAAEDEWPKLKRWQKSHK